MMEKRERKKRKEEKKRKENLHNAICNDDYMIALSKANTGLSCLSLGSNTCYTFYIHEEYDT